MLMSQVQIPVPPPNSKPAVASLRAFWFFTPYRRHDMSDAAPQNTREARLVPFQDDNGFHLCIGFIKEVQEDGRVVFEDQGNIAISYGAYEIAIQDLEICLSQAKTLLEARKKALAEQAAAEAKA
jgi:hypothetical protein